MAFALMCIEQNFGPHIEQNSALLKYSSGSVSSCIACAVSGSSDEAELLLPVERVARAGERVVAIARARAVARDVGRVRRDLVGDEALACTSSSFGRPRCSFGVT